MTLLPYGVSFQKVLVFVTLFFLSLGQINPSARNWTKKSGHIGEFRKKERTGNAKIASGDAEWAHPQHSSPFLARFNLQHQQPQRQLWLRV